MKKPPHSSSHNRLNIAHRLFVYYVGENIFRNADGNMLSRVSSEHLKILRLEELRDHCEKLGVPKSGNKGELISRLVTARISYDNLLVEDLKDILYYMNLPVSGNKSELIARIIGRGSSSFGADEATFSGLFDVCFDEALRQLLRHADDGACAGGAASAPLPPLDQPPSEPDVVKSSSAEELQLALAMSMAPTNSPAPSPPPCDA